MPITKRSSVETYTVGNLEVEVRVTGGGSLDRMILRRGSENIGVEGQHLEELIQFLNSLKINHPAVKQTTARLG